MLVEHPETRSRVKIVTHDLMAPISPMLVKKIGRIDYIINLASMSDVAESLVDPPYAVRSNVEVMLTMLEYARIAQPKMFLHISTDEVYGPSDGTKFHKEWDPILPSSPYSAGKAAQEAIAVSYWRSFGVPLVIMNLMNNFGEMQSTAKFPAIAAHRIWKGKTVTIHGSPQAVGSRFYIHSRNSADAMLFVINRTWPHMHEEGAVDRPDRYNVVGGECFSNLDMAKLIAKSLGQPLKYEFEDFARTRPGHDHHYGLNGDKLTKLGWTAPVSMRTSLHETMTWYKQHPKWLEPKA
jgi:dTDP-glucose 4,6-dehydratase